MGKKIVLGALVALLLSTQGCCTVVRGTTDSVTVTCASPGAKLTVDGEPRDFGILELARAQRHQCHVSAPGCQSRDLSINQRLSAPAYATEIAEAFLAGFSFFILSPPVIVDMVNGAGYDLVPKNNPIELEPLGGGAYLVPVGGPIVITAPAAK